MGPGDARGEHQARVLIRTKTGRASRRDPLPGSCQYCYYLLVELPELPPVEPPVLGVGEGDLVVEDEEPLPMEPDEEPDALPVELPLVLDGLLVLPLELEEPDLLKWASHSEREIWPSLLVSTDEKLGVLELPDELALGVLDEPPAALLDDLPDELPLVAEGDLVELDEESAATASVDRAKSAAAVVTVTVLSIENSSKGVGEALIYPQAPCRAGILRP